MRCLLVTLPTFGYYNDLARACADNAIEVVSVPCQSREDGLRVLEAVHSFRPHFILNHPVFSLLVSRIGAHKGIPVLHWLADKIINQEHLRKELYSESDIVLATYRGDADKLVAADVKAYYLPNACNIKPMDYHVSEKKYGVSFVGTIELGINNYYRRFMEETRARFCQESPLHASVFQTMQEAFEEVLQQQQVVAEQFRYVLPELVADIYRRIGPLLLQSNLHPDDLSSLLAKETASRQRRQIFQALPQLDAFGPEDWTQAGLPNVRYRGVAEQYRESGQVFAASCINLAITRIYALDGLSDRIFNVMRAQGFLLANRQETLAELFREGVDLEAYASLDELLDKVRFYTEHADAAERIARQGCDTVLRGHTFTHRIGTMRSMLARWSNPCAAC
ncbi:MAG: glycosyltransferase family 1 protein [Magnetococcales bacterium]|nr:glycosyltransferase family 1 protein [Magnetococcales bacterium]